MKLQIQKRKQQRIEDLIKKREQEETKLKNLKELKDKQLKLVQNNVRRARQRQQQQQKQQQQQQQDQEAAEVSTYVWYKAMIALRDIRKVWCRRKASQYRAWQLGATQVIDMQNAWDTLGELFLVKTGTLLLIVAHL